MEESLSLFPNKSPNQHSASFARHIIFLLLPAFTLSVVAFSFLAASFVLRPNSTAWKLPHKRKLQPSGKTVDGAYLCVGMVWYGIPTRIRYKTQRKNSTWIRFSSSLT